MALGASVHWSEALEQLTGETELNATALLEYFEPLHRFLREANGDLEAEAASVADNGASSATTLTTTTTLALILLLILNRYP